MLRCVSGAVAEAACAARRREGVVREYAVRHRAARGRVNADETAVDHRVADERAVHDNATGAVANMELVRVISTMKLHRTVRVLFCNEEHSPWHSLTYAKDAFENGDNIIAVINQDSLCGKSDEDAAAGINTHAIVYSTDEGKALAEFIAPLAEKYGLNLRVTVAQKNCVNDDDGSFIKAGYPRTVMALGSYPYGDSQYHLPGDIPERVSIENLRLSTQLTLAAILELNEK